MKRLGIICMLLALLTGCTAEETFETVADDQIAPVMAEPKSVSVALPEDLSAPVLESDTQLLYMGENYELILEKVASGDLNRTVQKICGYDRDDLTVMKTKQGAADRYEFVWAAAGETGNRLGRAVILDDGAYHYCLSVLCDGDGEEKGAVWNAVFSSFALTDPFIHIG